MHTPHEADRAHASNANASTGGGHLPMLTRLMTLVASLLLALSIVSEAPAQAPKEIVIGVLYPLSGPVAQVGIDSVNAVKLATDIINTGGSTLALPLGKTAGLPGLGGAKIPLLILHHH